MSSYYTKYYSQDMFLSNHLITMYAKCGSIVYARKVFDEISERNVVSWTALITGYAQAWDEREGFCLFSDMLTHCCPNEFALSSVFDFVRVSSRVRGFECTFFVFKVRFCDSTEVATALDKVYSEVLEEFNECYKLFTEMSHCKDIVAWTGIITAFVIYDPKKAIRLFDSILLIFQQMDVKPDSATFVALLSACSHAGRVEEGMRIFRSMFEKPESFPQLNHYACVIDMLGRAERFAEAEDVINAEGSFNEADKSRKEMETWRVRKEPGLCWTEIGNKVHNEKLALAYAVMEGRKSGGCGVSLIQIMKNIRICIDCHNFMKLASKLLGKEILVRDSNRFHHFKDDSCSCNDYW
ncbi:unnamed protein product [Cochlearia groenlandica]